MIALFLSIAFATPPSVAQLALDAYAAEFMQDRVTVPRDHLSLLHQRACDAGSVANCVRKWPTGVQQSAAKVLGEPCAEGDQAACMVVAWSQVQTEPGKIDAQLVDADNALKLFSAACEAGLERGCVEQGVLLSRGLEGEAGLARAHSLFQTACQVGELAGCRRLGAMYHAGHGIERDLGKARTYYQKACDGGYMSGCNGVALIDHLGIAAPRDPVAAEKNYIKACDAGHVGACNNLDKLYRNGVNPDLDFDAALRVWASGCRRGSPAACANGGRLADDPRRGDDRSSAEALKMFETGCNLGDAFTCGLLGKQLLSHEPDRGIGLLQTSCAQGVAPACSDLADIFWEGQLIKKDKKRARSLYTTACNEDYEPACARAR